MRNRAARSGEVHLVQCKHDHDGLMPIEANQTTVACFVDVVLCGLGNGITVNYSVHKLCRVSPSVTFVRIDMKPSRATARAEKENG